MISRSCWRMGASDDFHRLLLCSMPVSFSDTGMHCCRDRWETEIAANLRNEALYR